MLHSLLLALTLVGQAPNSSDADAVQFHLGSEVSPTDHFNLDAQKNGWERYHESHNSKLMLIVGEEVSPRYNHYLALGHQKPVVVWKSEANPQRYIDEVNAQGGFGFAVTIAQALAHAWRCKCFDRSLRGFAGGLQRCINQ